MGKVLVTEQSLEDIADAIRETGGTTDTYRPGDMANAIRSIPVGVGDERTIHRDEDTKQLSVIYDGSSIVLGDDGIEVSGSWVRSEVTVPTASDSDPSMDGTASAGTAESYSRGDHVHPTDTTRAAKADVMSTAQDKAGYHLGFYIDGDGDLCQED